MKKHLKQLRHPHGIELGTWHSAKHTIMQGKAGQVRRSRRSRPSSHVQEISPHAGWYQCGMRELKPLSLYLAVHSEMMHKILKTVYTMKMWKTHYKPQTTKGQRSGSMCAVFSMVADIRHARRDLPGVCFHEDNSQTSSNVPLVSEMFS